MLCTRYVEKIVERTVEKEASDNHVFWFQPFACLVSTWEIQTLGKQAIFFRIFWSPLRNFGVLLITLISQHSSTSIHPSEINETNQTPRSGHRGAGPKPGGGCCYGGREWIKVMIVSLEYRSHIKETEQKSNQRITSWHRNCHSQLPHSMCFWIIEIFKHLLPRICYQIKLTAFGPTSWQAQLRQQNEEARMKAEARRREVPALGGMGSWNDTWKGCFFLVSDDFGCFFVFPADI